jgi:hypothetical protein
MIFTTNYSTYECGVLKPQHLHGRFALPLHDLGSIVAFDYGYGQFEYRYLFGGNGFEKLSRLNRIRQHGCSAYDLGFFYDVGLNLGHLLIYGLSFGTSGVLSDEFLRAYPQHVNCYLIMSVDGHILLRLGALKTQGKLASITASYYSEKDQRHIMEMLKMAGLADISTLVDARELLAIE